MPFCEAMEVMFEIRKVEADGNLIADVVVSGSSKELLSNKGTNPILQ
jgi:hypothetical protein